MGEVEHGVPHLSIPAPGRLHQKGTHFNIIQRLRIPELHEKQKRKKYLRNEDSTLEQVLNMDLEPIPLFP